MRHHHPRRQRPPAIAAAGISAAYAVIVGTIGTVLVATGGEIGRSASYQAGWPTATYPSYPDTGMTVTYAPTTPAWPTTSSTTSTTPSTRFVQVAGGGGVTTGIPAGWSREALSDTVDEAADPTEPLRLVRFGGAAAADERPLLDRVTEYERRLSGRRDGYLRLRLGPTSFGGAQAVQWEYEYRHEDGVQVHCSAHYWMASGIEYVLYVQAPSWLWPGTEHVFETMVESAGPVS